MERDYEVTNSELREICDLVDRWGKDMLSNEDQQIVDDIKYFEYNLFV